MDITTLALAKAYTDEQVKQNGTGGTDLSGYYTKEEIDAMDYVKSEDISTEIDSALTEAKASGEFDGADGKDGAQGPKGEDGKISQVQKKIVTAAETNTLEPNTMYIFNEVDNLNIEFNIQESNYRDEYIFSFISGATPTVLTLPSSVQWANELTVEANKRYEVSVVDNIGLWCAVDLAVSE